MTQDIPTALVTGGSQGLGRALVEALDARGWRVITDARRAERLAGLGDVVAVAGDVADPAHRDELVRLVGYRLDLLVNNASALGASPLPRLADLPPPVLAATLTTNVVAPHALTQALLPALREARGAVVNISSDAAVEAYAGWGGYGASKAALDHLSRVLAEEEPTLRVYAVDPGDMRTEMHQDAFPGEDISDRPPPASVVPALLRLLDERPPGGRLRAADWQPVSA